MDKGVEDGVGGVEGAADVKTRERGHIGEGINKFVHVAGMVVPSRVVPIPPAWRSCIGPVIWPDKLKSSSVEGREAVKEYSGLKYIISQKKPKPIPEKRP